MFFLPPPPPISLVCPTVLKVFLILIPPILGVMARFKGKVSLSEVDFSVGESHSLGLWRWMV